MRYDSATGLYWMSVRAYDPTLGRFLQRDPLGRTPLLWADQPYVYAGNNPLINVDPSGQLHFHLGGGFYFEDPPHADGWVHFVHGTVAYEAGHFGATIDPWRGGGDFGVGFYAYVNDKWGREAATAWAKKKAKSEHGHPALVYENMKWSDYERFRKLYVGPNDLDAAYRKYYKSQRTGYDIVIGFVGVNGANGERIPRWDLPIQYKFEGETATRALIYEGVNLISW